MNYIAYNRIFDNERSQTTMNETIEVLKKEQEGIRAKRAAAQFGSETYYQLLEVDERLQKMIDQAYQAELKEREQDLNEEKLNSEMENAEKQRKHEKRGRFWDIAGKIMAAIATGAVAVGAAFITDAMENPGSPSDPKIGRNVKEVGKTLRQRINK